MCIERIINIHKIDRYIQWNHHVHPSRNCLSPELEGIDWFRAGAQAFDLIPCAIEQRLAGAYRRTHRLHIDRGAVITHIALHHQIHSGVHFWHPKGASQHAIVTGDAARLACRLHHAIRGPFDGICRAHFRASGGVAVHTDHGDGLRGQVPVYVIQLDHGLALVRVTFRTCLHTGLAADTPGGVNEKFFGGCFCHERQFSPFRTRTAHTLYSGIFEMGSCAAMVNWLADFLPGQ